MLKIIIDTNVLISALIQKNYPYFILHNILFEGNFELCISDELLEEYIEVLHRPKFAAYPDFLNQAEYTIAKILDYSIKYTPTEKIELLKDVDDNKILELAKASNADFIITGNIKDFTISEFNNTKIKSPKDFWEIFYNL